MSAFFAIYSFGSALVALALLASGSPMGGLWVLTAAVSLALSFASGCDDDDDGCSPEGLKAILLRADAAALRAEMVLPAVYLDMDYSERTEAPALPPLTDDDRKALAAFDDDDYFPSLEAFEAAHAGA